MSENLIEFNNISKFFGKVIALKDVTMKLKKGEIMCLLGDNGAGKSTLGNEGKTTRPGDGCWTCSKT